MLAMMVIVTIPSFSLQVVVAREVAQEPGEGAVAGVLATRGRQALRSGSRYGPRLRPVAVHRDLAQPSERVAGGGHSHGGGAAAADHRVPGGAAGPAPLRRTGASLAAEGAARFAAAVAAIAVGAGATGVPPRRRRAPAAGRRRAVAAAALVRGGGAAPRRAGRAGPRPPSSPASRSSPTPTSSSSSTPPGPRCRRVRAAAFVGKIVLMLPIAVATVLIPEVAARQSPRRPRSGCSYRPSCSSAPSAGS